MKKSIYTLIFILGAFLMLIASGCSSEKANLSEQARKNTRENVPPRPFEADQERIANEQLTKAMRVYHSSVAVDSIRVVKKDLELKPIMVKTLNGQELFYWPLEVIGDVEGMDINGIMHRARFHMVIRFWIDDLGQDLFEAKLTNITDI